MLRLLSARIKRLLAFLLSAKAMFAALATWLLFVEKITPEIWLVVITSIMAVRFGQRIKTDKFEISSDKKEE